MTMRLWPLLILLLITIGAGQIQAAPAEPVAVLFSGQWSAAARADAVTGVQRGLDFWQPTPKPFYGTAYDAGAGPLCRSERYAILTIVMSDQRGLSYTNDYAGRCSVVYASGDNYVLPTPIDRTAFVVAHELGHAVYGLGHFAGQDCYQDIMAGRKAEAYLSWYIGECSRAALEAL